MKQLIPKLQTQLHKPSAQIALIFSLIFLRYLFFGLKYYPQLDDFIQHHNYIRFPAYTGNSLWSLIQGTGMLSFRPLAGILDLTLWSALFPCMIVGVALISFLYAVSAWLFYDIFQEITPCSPLFLVIYTLIPLGFEGTYWMSASTRIIPALFFSALAVWYFHRYCKEGRKKDFPLYFLFQCLSYGFYEQCLVFSITIAGLLALYHLFRKEKRAFAAFSIVASGGIYWAVTSLASTSAMVSGRTELIFPSPYYYEVFLPELLSQLKSAFLSGGFYTIYTGFFRGIAIIIEHYGYWYLILSLFLVSLLFLYSPKELEKKPSRFSWILGFVMGFLLFLAPISIFFVIANTWFGLRCTVASFCGIALMIDVIFTKISNKIPISTGIAVVLAMISMIASVSELHDYKATYEDDLQVAQAVFPLISTLERTEKVAVLGLEASFLEEQNFAYHEHLHGVTESDWALSGRLAAYGKQAVPSVTPMSLEKYSYYPYHGGTRRPENFDHLFLYDHETGEMTPLVLEIVEEEAYYRFYDPFGNLLATLTEEEGRGKIETSFQ